MTSAQEGFMKMRLAKLRTISFYALIGLFTVTYASPIPCTAFAKQQQSSGVTLSFSPESEKFADATRQYQSIWNAESKRIIAAMEEVSGLKFKPQDVRVIVFEGPSESGFEDKPMKLRASYPSDTKKATLIHELGHRLNAMIRERPDGIDEHRVLFLYLYDVWIKLYGKSFADHEVEVEKQRKGRYDYETAWNWALSMSEQERAAKLREITNNK
jgi:hypothetical protein